MHCLIRNGTADVPKIKLRLLIIDMQQKKWIGNVFDEMNIEQYRFGANPDSCLQSSTQCA